MRKHVKNDQMGVCLSHGHHHPDFAQEQFFTIGDLPVRKGKAVAVEDMQMTAKRCGPVMLMGVGGKARGTDLFDHVVDGWGDNLWWLGNLRV